MSKSAFFFQSRVICHSDIKYYLPDGLKPPGPLYGCKLHKFQALGIFHTSLSFKNIANKSDLTKWKLFLETVLLLFYRLFCKCFYFLFDCNVFLFFVTSAFAVTKIGPFSRPLHFVLLIETSRNFLSFLSFLLGLNILCCLFDV